MKTLEKNTKIIIIIALLLIVGIAAYFVATYNYNNIEYTTIGNTAIGTVEKAFPEIQAPIPPLH